MQEFLARPVKFIALLGLGSLAYVPLLHAQGHVQSPSGEPSAQQAQPRQVVSDSKFVAFAKAYVEVQKIKESHQVALKNARDLEQVQQLQEKTNAEMAKAMENQGFTPETYAQMLKVINSDETLNKKALEIVQKEKAG
jgi:transcription initiation factor IIF auxiliary subunit